MPRIRTLKPEHKQHRKIGLLTDRQYRLWVGMLTEADDHGRLVADASWLRAVVFPYQARLSAKMIASDLAELEAAGLIRLYRVGDTPYAVFDSWRDHQYVPKAQPSKLPSPPDHSGNATVTRQERAGSVPVGSEGIKDQGSEGIGREGIGRGGEPPQEFANANGHESTNGHGVEPKMHQQDKAHHAIVAHVELHEPRKGLRDQLVRALEQRWVADVRAGRVDPEAAWVPA